MISPLLVMRNSVPTCRTIVCSSPLGWLVRAVPGFEAIFGSFVEIRSWMRRFGRLTHIDHCFETLRVIANPGSPNSERTEVLCAIAHLSRDESAFSLRVAPAPGLMQEVPHSSK